MQHFLRPVGEYRRETRLIPTYIEDSATYLAKQTGKPIEECRDFVRQQISPGGQFELEIPDALVLVRNRLGDRELKTMPFTQFLEGVMESNEILSPSMAAYVPPEVRKSILGEYIGDGPDNGRAALQRASKKCK